MSVLDLKDIFAQNFDWDIEAHYYDDGITAFLEGEELYIIDLKTLNSNFDGEGVSTGLYKTNTFEWNLYQTNPRFYNINGNYYWFRGDISTYKAKASCTEIDTSQVSGNTSTNEIPTIDVRDTDNYVVYGYIANDVYLTTYCHSHRNNDIFETKKTASSSIKGIIDEYNIDMYIFQDPKYRYIPPFGNVLVGDETTGVDILGTNFSADAILNVNGTKSIMCCPINLKKYGKDIYEMIKTAHKAIDDIGDATLKRSLSSPLAIVADAGTGASYHIPIFQFIPSFFPSPLGPIPYTSTNVVWTTEFHWYMDFSMMNWISPMATSIFLCVPNIYISFYGNPMVPLWVLHHSNNFGILLSYYKGEGTKIISLTSHPPGQETNNICYYRNTLLHDDYLYTDGALFCRPKFKYSTYTDIGDHIQKPPSDNPTEIADFLIGSFGLKWKFADTNQKFEWDEERNEFIVTEDALNGLTEDEIATDTINHCYPTIHRNEEEDEKYKTVPWKVYKYNIHETCFAEIIEDLNCHTIENLAFSETPIPVGLGAEIGFLDKIYDAIINEIQLYINNKITSHNEDTTVIPPSTSIPIDIYYVINLAEEDTNSSLGKYYGTLKGLGTSRHEWHLRSTLSNFSVTLNSTNYNPKRTKVASWLSKIDNLTQNLLIMQASYYINYNYDEIDIMENLAMVNNLSFIKQPLSGLIQSLGVFKVTGNNSKGKPQTKYYPLRLRDLELEPNGAPIIMDTINFKGKLAFPKIVRKEDFLYTHTDTKIIRLYIGEDRNIPYEDEMEITSIVKSGLHHTLIPNFEEFVDLLEWK